MKTYLLWLSTRCISTWFLKSSILKSKYSHKSILGFFQQRNSMGHAKMQKNFNIFFAAVASILFCKNLEINVVTLSPWSVIIWSFKPRVSRNLNLQCRHFFLDLIHCVIWHDLPKLNLFWFCSDSGCIFLAFPHYVISDDIPKCKKSSVYFCSSCIFSFFWESWHYCFDSFTVGCYQMIFQTTCS